MVAIIDDRGDVWQWVPNLVKVKAYDFFVGVGDINSSFLPKQHVIEAAKPAKVQAENTDKTDAPKTANNDTDKEKRADSPQQSVPMTSRRSERRSLSCGSHGVDGW